MRCRAYDSSEEVQTVAAPKQPTEEGIGALPSVSDGAVQRLNLNLLYPLDAILHAPTLTAAGRRVNLAQSTMSHALRRLRDHFHDDLVVVIGSELQLTSLGMALRDPVRKVVREVEETFRLKISFDPLTTAETITIAATETAEGMLLAPIIRSLAEKAPKLVVSVIPLHNKADAQSLDHGADLFLLPMEMANEQLATIPIFTDSVSCMFWNHHGELGSSLEITEAQYRTARHIVANDEPTDSFALDPHGNAMLRDRCISVRTVSLAMIPAIIAGSDLIATGSSWLFQFYAGFMPLRVVPAPFARRRSTIVAQWPRHRQSPKVMWFLDQVKSHYGPHDLP